MAEMSEENSREAIHLQAVFALENRPVLASLWLMMFINCLESRRINPHGQAYSLWCNTFNTQKTWPVLESQLGSQPRTRPVSFGNANAAWEAARENVEILSWAPTSVASSKS